MKKQLLLSIVLGVLVIGVGTVSKISTKQQGPAALLTAPVADSGIEPAEPEFVLPVQWKDLGKKMTEAGVIDEEKIALLYEERGGLGAEAQRLLTSDDTDYIVINEDNAGLILNLLWAFGLSNKNAILEKGPMADPRYETGNFASTGGWTLSKGDAMDHYSRHPFIVLTPEQQKLVERVSKNIYRPCCDNPAHFPDCNHGMAMLGLLELLASQGASQKEMYKTALRANAYWFPDAYLTIAEYLASQGVDWETNPKTILGAAYSNGSGYERILSQAAAPSQNGNGGCGV